MRPFFLLCLSSLPFAFSCHHSLRQINWNISVTSAVKEIFFFPARQQLELSVLRMFAASSRLNKIIFSHRSVFACVAPNLSKYLTAQLHLCCAVLQLSWLFPRISPAARKGLWILDCSPVINFCHRSAKMCPSSFPHELVHRFPWWRTYGQIASFSAPVHMLLNANKPFQISIYGEDIIRCLQ